MKALNSQTKVMALFGFAVGLFAAPCAVAQYRLPADGALFDANPRVGAGGRNTYQRPAPPLLGGNALAEGQIGRGFSFRGYSPIPDPLEFRGSLGSSALTSFRRDAISVEDAGLSRSSFNPGGLGLGRFNRTGTVPTAGFLSGDIVPGARNRDLNRNTPRYQPYLPGQTASITEANALAPDVRSTVRRPGVGMPYQLDNQTPLSSSIFGLRSQQPALPLQTGLRRSDADPTDPYRQLRETSPLEDRTLPSQQGNARVPGTNTAGIPNARSDARPLANLLGVQVRGTGADQQASGATPGYRQRSLADLVSLGVQPRQRSADDARGSEGQLGSSPVASALLPGADVFADMQMTRELQESPGDDWFKEMQSLRSAAGVAGEIEPGEFLQKMTAQPLSTFVGEGDTVLNRELADAEAAMDTRDFYRAAAIYESAARIAPTNPLPLLGRAHALLAAGDYASAAVSLQAALQKDPALLASFSYDLERLLGGAEIIDIRRSDLRRQLEQDEDPRLRLLLGYLEYFGGQRDRGAENLRKAADSARLGPAVIAYVDTLLGQSSKPRQSP
jgi:hypothetical protein